MTCTGIFTVVEAAHELAFVYRTTVIKECRISAPTFSRWVRSDNNTPIFIKYTVGLAVQLALETIKPLEPPLLVIPEIPINPLSKQQPLLFIYNHLLDLGKSVQKEYSKELGYSAASYYVMKNKGFKNLSIVEVRGFKIVLTSVLTELIAQLIAIAKAAGVAYEHIPKQVGSTVKFK